MNDALWIKEYLATPFSHGTQRNCKLYVAACAAVREGWAEQDIFSQLGAKAMRDGLKGLEIQATIKSALKSARSQNGYRPSASRVIAWDAVIGGRAEAKKHEVPGPGEDWEFADLPRFLSALFKDDEVVAYNAAVQTREDGKAVPSGWGNYKHTAAELRALLGDCRASEAVHATEHGAWCKLNPVDGKGINDENVTDYRHCLVECDEIPVEQQLDILRRFKVPCSTIVHSGRKSLHAAVRIDAGTDRALYDARVAKLYGILEAAGMDPGKLRSNRNPSRLSRLPGVFRGENPQYLVATNLGFASWAEFEASITAPEPVLEPWMPSDVSLWIREDAPPRNWVLENMLAVGEVGAAVAAGSTGKTFLLEEIAVGAACGRSFFASFGKPKSACRVLAFFGEDDEIALWARFRAIAKHFQITDEEFQLVRSNLRIFCGLSEPLLSLRYGVPERTTRHAWLAREIEAFDPRLLIIDPKTRFDATDENRANDATAFLVAIQDLVRGRACALVAHHVAKAQTGELTAEAGRGSGAFKDGCRWSSVLAGLSDQELTNFGLEGRRRFLKFDVPKANHSAALPEIVYLERNPAGVLFEVDLAAGRVGRIGHFLGVWLNDFEDGVPLRDLQRNQGEPAKAFREALKAEVPKARKTEILTGIEQAVREGFVLVSEGNRGVAILRARPDRKTA